MNIRKFNWKEISSFEIMLAGGMLFLIVMAWTASRVEYFSIIHKSKLPIFQVSSNVVVSPSVIKSGNRVARVSGVISIVKEKETDTKLAIAQKSIVQVYPTVAVATKPEKIASSKSVPAPKAPAISTIITPPSLIGQTMPSYPSKAVEEGIEGDIILKVLVSERGMVSEVGMEQSSGYNILDNSALTAARTWKFNPAKSGNKAVESWFKIPIKFQIKS